MNRAGSAASAARAAEAAVAGSSAIGTWGGWAGSRVPTGIAARIAAACGTDASCRRSRRTCMSMSKVADRREARLAGRTTSVVVLTASGGADLDHELPQAQDVDRALPDGGRRLDGIGAPVDAGEGLDLDDVEPSTDRERQDILLEEDRPPPKWSRVTAWRTRLYAWIGSASISATRWRVSVARSSFIPVPVTSGVGLLQSGGGEVELTGLMDLESEVTRVRERISAIPSAVTCCSNWLPRVRANGDCGPRGPADQAPEFVQVDRGGVERGAPLAPRRLE